MKIWRPLPSPHMCGYLFETFPPVLASCSTFYLLVCSRVSHRRRGSAVLGHAEQRKSTFFWHLANYQRGSGCLDKITCWTAVNTDKNVPVTWFWIGLIMIFSGFRLGFAWGFGSCCTVKTMKWLIFVFFYFISNN